jgi:hypothetical protein
VALTTVNGKWYRPPLKGAAGPRQLVPVWDLPAQEVQPACNTQFEFVLSHPPHLDKNPIRQHAGEASRKTLRFGFDWGWT